MSTTITKRGVDDVLAAGVTLDDLDDGVISLDDWRSTYSESSRRKSGSKATRLVGLVEAAGDQLFHDQEGEPWVTVWVDDHRETYRLRSRQYRRLLSRRYYEKEHSAPDSKALQDAFNVLEGMAVVDGEQQDVSTRIAEQDAAIYLDLGDETWQAIEITKDGWRVVKDPPVKFRRPRGMQALPIPKRGGSVKNLQPYINVAEEDDWRLLVSWLVTSFYPTGPYPVLLISGPQGSAKSTLVRILRLLVDPNSAPLRAEPRELRDLMIAAANGWIIGFDNLSYLKPDLSDSICRLATGGGFGTRELYTDGEEILFDAQRPVTLNGIGDLASRGDLLDRAILINLPVIPEGQRRTEAKLWKEFEADRPAILGALLDAFSASIRNLSRVRLTRMPRMADFAVRAAAAASALGWTAKDFLNAYDDNRDTGHAVALEASPIPELLSALVKDKPWTGTAADLLARLNELKGDFRPSGRGWPTTPKGLSEAVRRLQPNLIVLGLEATFYKEPNRRRRRLITIKRIGGGPPSKGRKRAPATSASADGVDAGWTQGVRPASTRSTLVADGVDGVDARIPRSGGTPSEGNEATQRVSPSAPRSPATEENLRPHRPHRPPLGGDRVDAENGRSSTPSSRASIQGPVTGGGWIRS